jgi:outer membrane protein assembly factor BamB
VRGLGLLLLSLAVVSCLPAVHVDLEPLPPGGRTLEGETRWSGEVRIAGQIVVPRGATLTIAPGSRVLFAPGPTGEPAALTVLGRITAEGTAEAPITLAAEGEGGPESWEGVRFDYVSGFSLRWVEIRDARYGIHAHFSSGTADHVRLAGNLEGARIGRSSIAFLGCRIEGNLSKGLSMTDSANRVTGCTITGNRYGVFLFEGSRGDRFEGNNIVGNGLFDLRLGDFFSGKVALRGNWWGPSGEEPLIDPPAAGGGPRDDSPSLVPFPDAGYWPPSMEWRSVASLATGGFTDAAPVIVGDLAVGGSWDGLIIAFSTADATPVWAASVGAPVDATPVLSDGLAILPAWDRTVRALELGDGRVRWSFVWPASGFDDHRQGSPVLFGAAVIIPGWNGTLYALEPGSGKLLWEREIGGALRARPLVTGDLLVVGSDHGIVAAVTAAGKLLWLRELGAGARGTPLAIGGRILLTLQDGRVVGLDPAIGATAWETRPGAGFAYASPIGWNGRAVVCDTAGNLSLLSPTDGAVSLTIPLGSPLYATPVVVGPLLVVGDTAGILRAIDPATGLTVRRADLGGPIQATPVVAGDLLIVGSRAGAYHLMPLP